MKCVIEGFKEFSQSLHKCHFFPQKTIGRRHKTCEQWTDYFVAVCRTNFSERLRMKPSTPSGVVYVQKNLPVFGHCWIAG